MRIESLKVIHLAKGAHSGQGVGALVQAMIPHAFHLDSCQRLLWVRVETEKEAKGESDVDWAAVSAVTGVEVFEGTDAYRFLLRVATGLESQIVGETDIFGQLKEAWRKMDSAAQRVAQAGVQIDVETAAEMSALMQRLFEDTKDIRSRYLQSLGGASYGSLVRMMLKQSPGPRLIVGAGQLAQSVAPYLLDQELWICNRSLEKTLELQAALIARAVAQGAPMPRIRLISAAEEALAWGNAASVVICIPLDAAKDAERVAWRSESRGPVIHLGGSREESGVWREMPGFEALDDLFALQKSQGDVRMTQVAHAARACDEKAKLRALGSSITLPHGWEDLAVFA